MNQSETVFDCYVDAPFGFLGLNWDQQGQVRYIEYLPQRPIKKENVIPPATQQLIGALLRYFEDPRQPLPAPPLGHGTVHQQKVWRLMCAIPCGQTLTYSAVAQKISSAPRAVGGACRGNPLPLWVPCHRIVAKNGLGGFAGETTGFKMDIKVWLLRHEGVIL